MMTLIDDDHAVLCQALETELCAMRRALSSIQQRYSALMQTHQCCGDTIRRLTAERDALAAQIAMPPAAEPDRMHCTKCLVEKNVATGFYWTKRRGTPPHPQQPCKACKQAARLSRTRVQLAACPTCHELYCVGRGMSLHRRLAHGYEAPPPKPPRAPAEPVPIPPPPAVAPPAPSPVAVVAQPWRCARCKCIATVITPSRRYPDYCAHCAVKVRKELTP